MGSLFSGILNSIGSLFGSGASSAASALGSVGSSLPQVAGSIQSGAGGTGGGLMQALSGAAGNGSLTGPGGQAGFGTQGFLDLLSQGQAGGASQGQAGGTPQGQGGQATSDMSQQGGITAQQFNTPPPLQNVDMSHPQMMQLKPRNGQDELMTMMARMGVKM